MGVRLVESCGIDCGGVVTYSGVGCVRGGGCGVCLCLEVAQKGYGE